MNNNITYVAMDTQKKSTKWHYIILAKRKSPVLQFLPKESKKSLTSV